MMLSVGTHPVVPQPIDDDPVNKLAHTIENEYPEQFVSLFGRQPLSEVCQVAARYCCYLLPNNNHQNNFVRWLSLMWIIDGLFDKRTLGSNEQHLLIENLRLIHDDQPRSPVNSVLLETVITLYQGWFDALDRTNSHAVTQLIDWTNLYLRTLIAERPTSLERYEQHRLESGAMMCVLWQLVLYMNLDRPDESMFRTIALIVSYHNDVISLDRDLRYHTPNLVLLLSTDHEYYLGYQRAIELTNQLYRSLPSELTEPGRSVVLGSYQWCHHEPRYHRGIELLRQYQWGQLNKNNFNGRLVHDERTVGDPTGTPRGSSD